MNSRTRGIVEMFTAMAASGTIGWFVIVSGQAPQVVVFWRCVFAMLSLGGVCLALGLHRKRVDARFLLLASIGGVAIVLNWVLLFAAYSRASIAVATAIYNTQPFILVLLGMRVFRERVTISTLAWMAVAFVGVVLITVGADGNDTDKSDYFLGIVLALGAALFWAVSAILTKMLSSWPPHLIALSHVTVGVLLLWPFATAPTLPSGNAWMLLATIGMVHTSLVYILMYDAIHRLPSRLQGAISFVYPAVALVVDIVAFDRHLAGAQILGLLAIFVAVGLASRRGTRQDDEAPPSNHHPRMACQESSSNV